MADRHDLINTYRTLYTQMQNASLSSSTAGQKTDHTLGCKAGFDTYKRSEIT